MTRALSWNMTFFRDPESIKGTGCQDQIMPLESHRSSTSTYIPVTYIFLAFCEFNQKVYMQSPWKTRGTMAQDCPEQSRAMRDNKKVMACSKEGAELKIYNYKGFQNVILKCGNIYEIRKSILCWAQWLCLNHHSSITICKNELHFLDPT